jgi:hypothetical protein
MTSMPQSETGGGDALADNVVVLGVDTHKDVHAAAVISVLGVFLGSQWFTRYRWRNSGEFMIVELHRAALICRHDNGSDNPSGFGWLRHVAMDLTCWVAVSVVVESRR